MAPNKPSQPGSNTNKKTDGFALSPLMAPVLSKYKASEYPIYVQHYKLYIGSLREIKVEGIVDKTQRRNERVVAKRVAGPEDIEFLVNGSWHTREAMRLMRLETLSVYHGGLLKKVTLEQFKKIAAFTGCEDLVDVANTYRADGEFGRCGTTQVLELRDVKAQLIQREAAQSEVRVVIEAKPVKPKGPATTPKKVRTPEEETSYAAKVKSRSERAAWFREHNSLRAKGKVLKTLSSQAEAIAVSVRKAAPGLTAEVHPDDGWKLVTHTRGRREKVVERTKTEMGSVQRRFTRSLERVST